MYVIPQRTHDAIITSVWGQNDVATSFWRHDDVTFASCVRGGAGSLLNAFSNWLVACSAPNSWPEPMLTYCQLDPWEETSEKIKIQTFLQYKMYSKSLQNVGHLVSTSKCWSIFRFHVHHFAIEGNVDKLQFRRTAKSGAIKTLASHISGDVEVRGVWPHPENIDNWSEWSETIVSSRPLVCAWRWSADIIGAVSLEHCKQASGCWISAYITMTS